MTVQEMCCGGSPVAAAPFQRSGRRSSDGAAFILCLFFGERDVAWSMADDFNTADCLVS
jgi:hypothetical protein